MNNQEAKRNEWLRTIKRKSDELASITPEQINKIKQEMDEKYERSNARTSDDVSDYYDYDSFLVESDIVDTRLVKELMLYAMHLRAMKIKKILDFETNELAEQWFTDTELDRQIKEIAIVEVESKYNER